MAKAKKMRVIIESQSLMGRRSGVGMYLTGLLEGLERVDHKNDYSLIIFSFLWRKFRPPIAFSHDNFGYKPIWMIPGRVFNQFLKRDLLLPLDLLINKKRLYFFPNFVRWPLVRSKSIVVIHDLSFFSHPQFTEEKNLRYMTKFVPRSIAKATHIVTNSNYSKQEIIKSFPIAKDKITVVNPGIDHDHYLPQGKHVTKRVKNSYGIKGDYVLYVGNIEPRKNLPTLIEAYSRLPKEIKRQYALVLAGGGMRWKEEKINQALNKHKGENIIRPGYIEQKDMPGLFTGASVFVFPSILEGFGIPPLEAMACGTPVICADNSSLPESVGNAALMFEATDVEALTENLEKVLTDAKLRRQLSQKGLEHSRKFTWEASATKLVKLFEKVHRS